MAKHTITIADIDLNITTEESPEMVEHLVTVLDRRIRDLLTRMPRLSKSEAAILCAVDYCAQSIKSETKTHEMERDFIKISKELETIRQEHEALVTTVDELRRENRIMHDIITKSVSTAFPAIAKPIEGEQLTIKTEEESEQAEAAQEQTVPAAQVMFQEEQPVQVSAPQSDPDIDDIPTRKVRRRTKVNPNGGKNKVGDMFDMLTFKDV